MFRRSVCDTGLCTGNRLTCILYTTGNSSIENLMGSTVSTSIHITSHNLFLQDRFLILTSHPRSCQALCQTECFMHSFVKDCTIQTAGKLKHHAQEVRLTCSVS